MKRTIKLKKNYEFNFIFKKGKYCSGNFLECFYIKKNKNISKNFIGIAISSKTCNAVTRNTIKRRILESYRKIEENLKTGYSIVILWKRNADIKNNSFNNIFEDIVKIFERIGLFNEEYLNKNS